MSIDVRGAISMNPIKDLPLNDLPPKDVCRRGVCVWKGRGGSLDSTMVLPVDQLKCVDASPAVRSFPSGSGGGQELSPVPMRS